MNSPEPIAIVGMACRFAAGIESPETFWDLLVDNGDTVGDLPDERWEWYAGQSREHAAVVRDVTRRGAFLENIKEFDADFFDVTPREAALMDPQQRITLELAWEALEHAGIRPRSLRGTGTGVFMGVGADDYGRRLLEDLPNIEAWTGIGSSMCAVANRVSYALDLRGPSMVVDTACSSSLVSIHLAAQALRSGECPVALAGGILVMAGPGLSVVLDAAGATSRDGRSKSFDAAADGYGRGEGGGVVVLKLLTDAQRDGDRVLAVIRGSAVQQDGKTNGIMAPNGEAQADLMRRTYELAGIDPATVSYVEAHGTGTSAGDPQEVAALAAVFGVDRPADAPCLIGSVKPNIGHLEAGAGVAGVIKTVLALQHAEIPANIVYSEPNPRIPWVEHGLHVVTENTPWPTGDSPSRAGISGYGYGGTIAHVILEAAPDGAADAATSGLPSTRPVVLPLSGASAAAVVEQAGRLGNWLDRHGDTRLADLGHTLGLRRQHLPHRAAVVAASPDALRVKLAEFELNGTGAVTGRTLPDAERRGLVWVFSGHGSQWIGMARELLAAEPAFTAVVDEIEPIFRTELGLSPREVIGSDLAQPVDVIQPMIFCVQVALAALWRDRGVVPDAVIGHSVGEIAAAVTAGMLTLEHGARLVCRRSVLLRQVAGQGAMAMVGLSSEEAGLRLAGRTDVAVAVAASTGSTVLSGDVDAVARIGAEFSGEGLIVQRVDSDVAFHSPQMDPLLDALATAAVDLPPTPAQIPVYSTALTDPRSDAPRDGAYWATNLRGTVRFAQAVAAAAADGYRLFVEISPHPVVGHSITETLDELGIDDAVVAHSLRRDKPELQTLLTNLGTLYCAGVRIDWAAQWPDGALTDVPTMAWQRKDHWVVEKAGRSFLTEQHDVESHTLLGGRINVHGANPVQAWLTFLDRESRPYPGDHPVRDVEIVPAAVLLNSFLTAAESATGVWQELSDVQLRVPVSVTHPRHLQVVLQNGAFRLSSRIVGDGADQENDDKGWVTHTVAMTTPHPGVVTGQRSVPATTEELPTGYVVDRLAALDVAAMGFPWAVEEIRRGADALVVTINTDPGDPDGGPATWAPLLDGALSAASVAFGGAPILRMPAAIQRVTLATASPSRARVTVRVVAEDTVDVEIADPDGRVVGVLSKLEYGVLDSEVDVVTSPRQVVHRLDWRPADIASGDSELDLVLVGPDTRERRRIVAGLGALGITPLVVTRPDDLADTALGEQHTVLVVPAAGAAGHVAATASWLLARTAQRVAAAGQARPARVWCVTEGVRESLGEGSLGHGSLWGVGRVIGGEHPDLWGGTVDVGSSDQDIRGLVTALRTIRGEDVVVIRDGEPEVARLHRVEGEPTLPRLTGRPQSTYLVTGGFGALGLEVTRWLADRGARRIILAGRTGLPPRDRWTDLTDEAEIARVDSVIALERLGISVFPVVVDIADPEDVAAKLSPAVLNLPAISGVVHAAGVLDDRTIRTLDEESLRRVMRPKVDGALNLHRLFPPGTVDFFVMFSSCGQLLGLPGQASYAAGNAFLDALAAHRRSAGDTGTASYAWTSWRGLGMSTSTAVIDAELAARGTADISATEAFSAWDLATRHGLAYAVMLRTLPFEPGMRKLALLSELPDEAATGVAVADLVDVPWAGLAGAELTAAIADEISKLVAVETGLAVPEVDRRRPLIEMGLDSVMTVRIRRGLERRFGSALPATLLWDRPTIDAVASLIVEQMAEQQTAEELAGETAGNAEPTGERGSA